MATYTMNNGGSGESSTTDKGTFSASTSAGSSTSTVTGKATQGSRATSSSSREDKGTCSGSTNSTFKNSQSNASYDTHSTESNYTVTDGSRTADGPYSSNRTYNSNSSHDESGTRAGGVTFSNYSSSSSNSLYSDSGKFSESPTTWSRKGTYTDISGSSSALLVTETSIISGGAATGTSTWKLDSTSQSGSMDTGTYEKYPSYTSVNGKYESSKSSDWHDQTDRTGHYDDGTTSYDFVSHNGLETKSSDNDAGKHSQGFSTWSREGERTQTSFWESKSSGSQSNGARTGTTTSTFSNSSDHTITKESETTTPYTITDAGSSWKSTYDVSELDESNYNSNENGSFNDGTKSGTFSDSSSGGTNNGLSDVGLIASDGTGNGLYHTWRSSNGTSTSERTEIQGTITTKTKNTGDSSFDYDDSNIYTFSNGQRTGSGTIELSTRSHLKVTQDTTGTYTMGSVTCQIDDHKLHEQSEEWKQQATYTFTGSQVQMNPSTGTRQHDEDQTHTWLYCINGNSYPMADTPINSHDGPQSIDGYPIGQQQPQSGGGGGSPGGGVAGRGSGGAGKAQPKDCNGLWDCLVHPDWDLYWHYLKNGNDNPVDVLDHVINIGGYVAQGAAVTAGLMAVALAAPVLAPVIMVGGFVMGGVGVYHYVANFGQMNANDHERFWGTLAGGLLVGGIAAAARGNCFVADTLVIMGPMDTDETVVAEAFANQTDTTGQPNGTTEDDEGTGWSRGRLCMLVGIGLGAVLAYYSLRPRRRREDEVDELLASGELIGISRPHDESDGLPWADEALNDDEVVRVPAECR